MRFLLLALALVFAAPALAQERDMTEARPSPNASVSQTVGTSTMTVDYGRPSVRGREIFGGLVPYDAVWRTGANEATVLTTDADIMVGDTKLAAGSYALFTVPGKEGWTVIFNSVAEQWGAYNYDAAQDVARVEVIAETTLPVQEQLRITFEDVTEDSALLTIRWDTVGVPVRVMLAG